MSRDIKIETSMKESTIMARKILNEEEIAELLQSPFVIAADEYKVYFSAEFKEMFSFLSDQFFTMFLLPRILEA